MPNTRGVLINGGGGWEPLKETNKRGRGQNGGLNKLGVRISQKTGFTLSIGDKCILNT